MTGNPYAFEKFSSIINYKDVNFLKDSSWIIYISDQDGQFNLWKQKLKDLANEINPFNSQRTTHFTHDSIRSAFPSHLNNEIVFFADRDGNQNYQIYRIRNLYDVDIEAITKNHKAQHEWGTECYSHDERYIMYTSNENDPANVLIYTYNLDKDFSECIINKHGWYTPGYWSCDDKFISCTEQKTLSSYALWMVDANNKEMIDLSLNKENVTYKAGPWSKDKKGFYFLSDENTGFTNLAFYNIHDNCFNWVITPNYDIEHIVLCDEKGMLLWVENIDGYSKICVKNLKSQETRKIDGIPNGVISKIKVTHDGEKVMFLLSTAVSPYDIYIYDLKSGNINKLTNSLKISIPWNIKIEPELVTYESFDNAKIPAFLYMPKNNILNQTKLGAVLSIHGGPMCQERPSYLYGGLYQYLLSKGLAVMAPNFRGSSGYGKNFEKKIYHDWGGDELKDLEHAIKWLLSQEWIDKNRIGVFGASFGGFATLNCITRLPHYNWRAAVDLVGPSNLVTFAKTVPNHWKRIMAEWVGDPETEKDFLQERSPITYADNLKSDLLIIQGAQDPLVVKEESEQMVNMLQKKGKYVEYVVFDDEGHGFTKNKNMIKAFSLSAEFLLKRLA